MADTQYQVGGGWGLGDGYALGSEYGYGESGPDPSQLIYQGPFGKATTAVQGSDTSTASLGLLNPTNNVWEVPSSASMVGSNQFGATANNAIMAGTGTIGAVTGGVGNLVGAYTNASDNTGASVLSGVASGAATGAEIGSIVPGIGTVVGGVIGGVLGGIAGFFGSKSKKNQEKKAFQQQEQAAVLPAQQQEANYLMNQGLLQKGISNYRSGYTPGGYQYQNALTGNKPGQTMNANLPSNNPSLPNFNQAPPNVVPGGGNTAAGIAPNRIPNNGVNLNPGAGNPAVTNAAGIGATGLVAPTNSFAPQAAPTTPIAPGYTGNQGQDNANLSAYQKNYAAMLNQQNQNMAAAAMDPYKQFFMQGQG